MLSVSPVTPNSTGIESKSSVTWSEDSSPRSDDSKTTSPPSVIMRNGQMIPRLPFCAAYDGVNLRRTRTISESIQDVLQEQFSGGLESLEEDEPSPFEVQEDDTESIWSSVLDNDASIQPAQFFVLLCKSNTTKILHDVDPSLGIDDDIKGYVDMILDYSAIENRLNVNVNGAKMTKKSGSSPDLYVTINPVERSRRRYKTRIVKRNREPKFGETFTIDHVNKKWMHILAMNVQLRQVRMFRDRVIGQAVIWLDDIDIIMYGRMNVRLLLN